MFVTIKMYILLNLIYRSCCYSEVSEVWLVILKNVEINLNLRIYVKFTLQYLKNRLSFAALKYEHSSFQFSSVSVDILTYFYKLYFIYRSPLNQHVRNPKESILKNLTCQWCTWRCGTCCDHLCLCKVRYEKWPERWKCKSSTNIKHDWIHGHWVLYEASTSHKNYSSLQTKYFVNLYWE